MTWIREQVRQIALIDWSFELRDDDIARIRFRGRDVLRSVRAVVRDRDWATAVWRVASVEVSNGAAERAAPLDERGAAITETADDMGRSDERAAGIVATADESGRSVDRAAQSTEAAEGGGSDGDATGAAGARADTAARIVLRSDSLGADLRAVLEIAAHGSALTVSLELTTAREFATNRTGLVVLHPPALAGSPLAVEHPSGEVTHTRFPTDIAPHQPAFDIAALEADGVRVEFAGDTFEMEDQRNWTDASFKTYNRPLALPFPYSLEAGETVRQSVTVSVDPAVFGRRIRLPEEISCDSVLLAPNSPSVANLSFDAAGPMPAISSGASTAPGDGATEPLGSTLLVELDLGWGGWRAAFDRAAASGLPLDVRLVLPEANAPAAVAEAVRELAPHRIARIAPFHPAGHEAEHVTDNVAVRILREALAAEGLAVPVLGGARSHFTELNREQHRIPGDLDGVVFSTTPLFHTLETLQLIEAIAMQRLVAEQAVRIAGGAPVHVGPITLRTHVNNVATADPPRPAGDDLTEGYGPELLDADDERQKAPELAAWTIASAAALAVPGVASLSFFEEWGPRGIRAADGSDFPVAEALRALAALEGPVATAHTPDGKVWAIRSSATTLIANLDEIERFAVPPRAWQATAR